MTSAWGYAGFDHPPLACMLGGEGRRTLFITTESLDPADRTARGRIETIQVDIAGLDCHREHLTGKVTRPRARLSSPKY